MGVLDLGREDTSASGLGEEYINGDARHWVDLLSGWYAAYRLDTFVFWPVAGNQEVQVEAFAGEVVPALKEALA
jgi:hypothetical protein